MDHRVSKDMISQGMSFKGEKTTEQLNGTQIGKIATPHNMLDAYQSMYSEDAKWGYDLKGNSLNPADKKKKKVKEDVQQVDEVVVTGTLAALGAKALAGGAAKVAAAGGAKALAGKAAGSLAKQAIADKAVSTIAGGNKKKTEEETESNPDDLIQELKDSGLFSEEELKEVLGTLTNADRKGNTPAWQNKDKKGKDGNPLYKMADHLKSPKLTTAPVKK